MREALPDVDETRRQLAGQLIIMTITAVGKEVSETPSIAGHIDAYVAAMCDMLCAYLKTVERY